MPILLMVWAWLQPFLLQFWKYILIAAMVLAAVLGIYHLVRENGVLNEQKKETERGIKGIQTRRKIEREFKRAPESDLDKWL